MEKNYNCKGICYEPVPYKFNTLKRVRPNSICTDKAVFNKTGEKVSFSLSNYCDDLSGITSHIGAHSDEVIANQTIIIVETITLQDLLDENGAPSFIEYLSLDPEGIEFEILQSVDHEKYKFGVIDVEHIFVEPRSEMRNYPKSKGYELENRYVYPTW